MNRVFLNLVVALLACAGARAATINTTLTVTATGTIGITSASFTGTASLTGGIGSGTISATLDLAKFTAPFTITLTSGTTGTITGIITVPLTILAGTGTATATITGGTGTYAGATGSFASLSGTGGIDGSGIISLTISGAGTITTSGGGPTGPPAPAITAVLDAGSYTKNIAQGSIFVVKGTNLSASGFTQLGFPLPATSGGVKITFAPTTGGAGTDAYLVYLFNQTGVNQLAAVLPSTVAAGNYNVTVTYNGTASAPFAATVVQRKLGLITADGSGTGLAVVQNFVSQSQLDIGRFTTFSAGGFTFSPSKPGQILVAWATGMGAVTGGDNTASPGFDFSKTVDVKVIVGGVSIAPLYAGRAPGLAGADQINFQLPATVPTGCTVSFQVSVNNVLSTPIFIAIAPDANSSACVQPGFTTAQLQKFDSGGSTTIGGFSLSQFSIDEGQLGTVKANSTGGGFVRYTGFQLLALSQNQAQQGTSSGSCNVIHAVSSSANQTIAVGNIAGLDAGAVTLNGPAGSGLTNQAYTQDPDRLSYSINLGTEGVPVPGPANPYKLVAGQYTIAGAGGKDVGKFNTSITLGAPLSITGGLPGSVNRSSGLTLNWTGGNPSDLVDIIGSSTTIGGTGTSTIADSWTFICTTTAGAGTFTVPSSILIQMPAVSASSTTGGGSLEFATGSLATFTAPLTAGGSIDAGTFLSLIGFGGSVSFQ